MDAWDANASDLGRRAAGVPIRVATKSVRCRDLLRDVLARDDYSGALTLTLSEALWLVATGVTDDAVVGYPTVDRAALYRLVHDEVLSSRVTIMVDDPAQLDLVDAVSPPDRERPSGCASSWTARGDRSADACGSAPSGPPCTRRRRWPGWPAWCPTAPASVWSA
jgi:hypothetical protein